MEIVSLALPALSQMAAAQRSEFLRIVGELIAADDKVTVYEYALRHILHRSLDSGWAKKPGRASTADLQRLLMTVAAIGAPQDDQAAASAYAQAITACGKSPNSSQFNRQQASDWSSLDLALRRLADVKPKVKRALIAASLQAVADDGVITPKKGMWCAP